MFCLLLFLQQVESSGYLQVGFFLYEFRRDSPFAPTDDTAQQGEDSASSNVTSDDVVDDTLTVTPWRLRSQFPGQETAKESESPANTSAHSSLPWRHATACNASTSVRPQYRFLLCLDYVNRWVNTRFHTHTCSYKHNKNPHDLSFSDISPLSLTQK